MTRLFFRTAATVSGVVFLAIAAPAFAKPVIGSVTPVSAATNSPTVFSVSIQSVTPIQSCNLYVDLEDVGAMTVLAGTASKSHVFPFGGSRIAFVFCRDTSGGMAAGANTAIWVTGALQNEAPLSTTPASEPEPEPAPVSAPAPEPASTPSGVTRRLLKLACPVGAATDDPCKAVYYVGADGKRHAFPNSRVFFTWYQNFDMVMTVGLSELASYQLGKNVTYRPGSRMVKFSTLNKTYAITDNGTLRWVKTEEIARSVYGTDWNTKVDDISDVFYNDYSFGADVDFANTYSVTGELSSNTTID